MRAAGFTPAVREMNDRPFALLLTWTFYDTWLPGDQRGYVANSRSQRGGFEPLHNVPGTAIDADHAESRDLARSLQKHSSVRLTQGEALLVADVFIAAAVKHNWQIVRGAVMANHVYLVVMESPDNGPEVRRVFKGVSQTRLRNQTGKSGRWWTQGGSDRYLHGDDAILAAVRYVKQQEYCLV